MSESDEVVGDEPRFSLQLYRKAQEAQGAGDHSRSAMLFALSILVDAEDVHPNALYQTAWSLACQREWELSRIALNVLLRQTPLHEAGSRLSETLDMIERLPPGTEVGRPMSPDMEHGTGFQSPRELRREVEKALQGEGGRPDR